MNMPDRDTLELITRVDPSFLLLHLKDTHFDVGLLQKMIDMAKEGARAALAAQQQAEPQTFVQKWTAAIKSLPMGEPQAEPRNQYERFKAGEDTVQQAEPEADERAAFEAWVSASGRSHLLERDETHGYYKDLAVTAWWTAWQARAAQLGNDHNPVEVIGEEFVKAKADPDPRAVDTLTEALNCTLREHGFALVPADDEEEGDDA